MRRRISCTLVGLSFLTPALAFAWDQDQQSARRLAVAPDSSSSPASETPFYRACWALLVGINSYPDLPPQFRLNYAVNDVQELEKLLIERYRFPASQIVKLVEEEATRERISTALGELTNTKRIDRNDCVLVYFAGHGQTVRLPGGGEMGFLLPFDAKIDLADRDNISQYYSSSLGMDELARLGKLIPARHVLFVVDACYSGLAFSTTRALEPTVPFYLNKVALLPVRQLITAGLRGEESVERAEWGHGAFTYKLLDALRTGVADTNGDGVITGIELGNYLRSSVPVLAAQTPQFGYLEGEGEFLFLSNRPERSSAGPGRTARPASEPGGAFGSALEALHRQEYERSYSLLADVPAKSQEESSRIAFLRTVIAGAHCAGSLGVLQLLGEGVSMGSKEEFGKAGMGVLANAGKWAKRVNGGILKMAGTEPIFISLILPALISDDSFDVVSVLGNVRKGLIPSAADQMVLEKFVVGVVLRQMIVRSVKPDASAADLAASEIEGTVVWVPEPVLSIAESLADVASRNAKAVEVVRRGVSVTRSELDALLRTAQEFTLEASRRDRSGTYRAKIKSINGRIDGALASLRASVEPRGQRSSLPWAIEMALSEAKRAYGDRDYTKAVVKFGEAIPRLEEMIAADTTDAEAHLELSGAYLMKMLAAFELPPGQLKAQAVTEAAFGQYHIRARKEIELFIKYAGPDHPKRDAARKLVSWLEEIERKGKE